MPHEKLYLDILEERKKVMYERPSLRPYQREIVDEVMASIYLDDLTVVAAATGAGKSVIISELCERLVKEGMSVAVLTNISALVPQLSKHLSAMGIDHNVVKAGMHDWEPTRSVHLVMEQSFHEKKRKELDLKVDVLIKDEYHIGVNGKRYREIMDVLDPDTTIGLTATPLDEKGFLLAPKENIIPKGTTAELVKEGYLCQPKYLIPKWAQNKDYSNVRMSGNDYSEVALREIIDTPEFTAQAIEAMEQIGFGTKQTAVYCCGIEHAENFAEALRKKGYECDIVHSKRPQKENESAIEKFKSGKTRILVSVSSLLIGFDAPNMELLVNLRPTRILRLWLQLGGRVLRTHEGKRHGEILDLGQCVSSLGFLEEPLPLIDPGDKKKLHDMMKKRERNIITDMVEETPTEVVFDQVIEAVEELERKARDYRKQPTEILMRLFDLENDFMMAMNMAMEIDRRIHGNTFGSNFADWATEPWYAKAMEFPELEPILLKAFKTRTKNVVKQGKKLASLHYFAAWFTQESGAANMFVRYDIPELDYENEWNKEKM